MAMRKNVAYSFLGLIDTYIHSHQRKASKNTAAFTYLVIRPGRTSILMVFKVKLPFFNSLTLHQRILAINREKFWLWKRFGPIS